MKLGLLTAAAVASLALATAAHAAEPAFTLTLKDHKFAPTPLEIPANTRVRLTVKNQDKTPAEFESEDFKVEKVIKGGAELTFPIGPLKPGSYEIYDEYHEDESKARLIAK